MAPGFTRYQPASGSARWLFVSGRSFVASVEPTAARSVIDALWWLAESESAPLESIVGAFPLAGDDEVRSFAVVSFEAVDAGAAATTVTSVIRGTACVDIFSSNGARRFSSEGVQPWVLADFRSVSGVMLTADDRPSSPIPTASADSLPLGAGVVAGEGLVWSLSPIESTEQFDVPQQPARMPGVESIPSDDTIIVQRSANVSSVGSLDERDDTIIIDRAGSTQRPPAWQIPPGPAAPRPRPVSAPMPELVGSPPGSVFHSTSGLSADAAAAARSEPLESDLSEPVAQIHERFGFRIGRGDVVLLDAPVIIGRNPKPSRIVDGLEPRLASVRSPELVVSSTHVQIQQVGDAVVVTDLRSTNGTFVTSPGWPRVRLRPGESRVLLPGATIDIGDGNIIEITPTRNQL